MCQEVMQSISVLIHTFLFVCFGRVTKLQDEPLGRGIFFFVWKAIRNTYCTLTIGYYDVLEHGTHFKWHTSLFIAQQTNSQKPALRNIHIILLFFKLGPYILTGEQGKGKSYMLNDIGWNADWAALSAMVHEMYTNIGLDIWNQPVCDQFYFCGITALLISYCPMLHNHANWFWSLSKSSWFVKGKKSALKSAETSATTKSHNWI